ncbi:glutathione S-transferase protein [Opisthorchis viverrini]|uniref:glutathione transferase n=1 Tax=Opisthorchis viverrini TaxID=6198 RepID=A0A1S8X7T3_OPIVI|nr:glutathione S-transferase protein [Opisthorchis viverrini]
MILIVSGTPFEDCRIEVSDWPSKKSTIPGGKLPILEVTTPCGKKTMMTESMATARYLAKQHNLMGETDEDYYKIEKTIGEVGNISNMKPQCSDLHDLAYKIARAPDAEKPKLIEELKKPENAPRLLNLMSETLKSNPSELVAGGKVSLGDIALLCTLDQVEAVYPGFLKENYAIFVAHRERVLALQPKLAEHIKTRPKTIV